MKIIQFESRCRDDLIFMILEAKNALGRVPGLNEDLLDIEKHYFAKGDLFWIAVDEQDRVIGSMGYNSIPDTSEIYLHRQADQKHQGIGTKLLATAEAYAKKHGKTAVYVHIWERRKSSGRSPIGFIRNMGMRCMTKRSRII